MRGRRGRETEIEKGQKKEGKQRQQEPKKGSEHCSNSNNTFRYHYKKKKKRRRRNTHSLTHLPSQRVFGELFKVFNLFSLRGVLFSSYSSSFHSFPPHIPVTTHNISLRPRSCSALPSLPFCLHLWSINLVLFFLLRTHVLSLLLLLFFLFSLVVLIFLLIFFFFFLNLPSHMHTVRTL